MSCATCAGLSAFAGSLPCRRFISAAVALVGSFAGRAVKYSLQRSPTLSTLVLFLPLPLRASSFRTLPPPSSMRKPWLFASRSHLASLRTTSLICVSFGDLLETGLRFAFVLARFSLWSIVRMITGRELMWKSPRKYGEYPTSRNRRARLRRRGGRCASRLEWRRCRDDRRRDKRRAGCERGAAKVPARRGIVAAAHAEFDSCAEISRNARRGRTSFSFAR